MFAHSRFFYSFFKKDWLTVDFKLNVQCTGYSGCCEYKREGTNQLVGVAVVLAGDAHSININRIQRASLTFTPPLLTTTFKYTQFAAARTVWDDVIVVTLAYRHMIILHLVDMVGKHLYGYRYVSTTHWWHTIENQCIWFYFSLFVNSHGSEEKEKKKNRTLNHFKKIESEKERNETKSLVKELKFIEKELGINYSSPNRGSDNVCMGIQFPLILCHKLLFGFN